MFKIFKTTVLLTIGSGLFLVAASSQAESKNLDRNPDISTFLDTKVNLIKSTDIKWGTNTADFISLLARLTESGPSLAVSLKKYLEPNCKAHLHQSDNGLALRGCKFIDLHNQYLKVQSEVDALLKANVLTTYREFNEVQLRALNWELDPFAEVHVPVLSNETTNPLHKLVEWLLLRKAMSQSMTHVRTYLLSLGIHPTSETFSTVLPAIRAHYSSPLVLGQIVSLFKFQTCPAELLLCEKIKADLMSWAVEQVQPLRPILIQAHSVLSSTQSTLPTIEPLKLMKLLEVDEEFQSSPRDFAEKYAEFLESASLHIDSKNSALTQAQVGVIVLNEILQNFGYEIPQWEFSSNPIHHPKITILEKRVREELDGPIYYLNRYLYDLEKELN